MQKSEVDLAAVREIVRARAAQLAARESKSAPDPASLSAVALCSQGTAVAAAGPTAASIDACDRDRDFQLPFSPLILDLTKPGLAAYEHLLAYFTQVGCVAQNCLYGRESSILARGDRLMPMSLSHVLFFVVCSKCKRISMLGTTVAES